MNSKIIDLTRQPKYCELVALALQRGYDVDCELQPVLYLLSLIHTVHADPERDLFDLKERRILPAGLEASWQTGSTLKASRLLFNLWNGHVDGATVWDLFGGSWDPYFLEAIRMRFPDTCGAVTHADKYKGFYV